MGWRWGPREPGCRAALLEAAVILNGAWSAYCLRQQFRSKFPDLGVVFGCHDLIHALCQVAALTVRRAHGGRKGIVRAAEGRGGISAASTSNLRRQTGSASAARSPSGGVKPETTKTGEHTDSRLRANRCRRLGEWTAAELEHRPPIAGFHQAVLTLTFLRP
jgi:hypothetical protein